MNAMWCRRISRFALLAAVFGLAASFAVFAQSTTRGRKYKAPPPTSRVEVTILRNDDGKPIENAAVIWHLVGDKGNMELKTNEDGKSVIDVLPTGSEVLLQVIAKGYQTYGQPYKLDKAQIAIQVKLRRPGEQYSVYKDEKASADAGKGPDKDSGKDGAKKDPPKDKSGDSAKQDAAQPEAGQPQPQ